MALDSYLETSSIMRCRLQPDLSSLMKDRVHSHGSTTRRKSGPCLQAYPVLLESDFLKVAAPIGTVVGLRPSGFGFIRPEGGQVDGMDLYFHAKECSRDSPFDELRQDDEVSLKILLDGSSLDSK